MIHTFAAGLVVAGMMIALVACAAPTPSPAGPTVQTTQTRLQAVRAALEAKQFEAALQQAQALVTDDPNNAEAHYLLGNAYNQLASAAADETTRRNHLTKAVDAYLSAIRLDPKHDAAHTNLATVYYQNGQFEQAQEYVQKALQLKPDDAVAHYMLGAILLQRDPQKYPDALDTAQKQFEAAIRYKPDLGAAYTGLANVFLFKGDYRKALENAQKGVDLTQNDPNPFTYWALAQAQCALGDKVNGTKSIERINSLNPTDPLFRQQVQALAEQCR